MDMGNDDCDRERLRDIAEALTSPRRVRYVGDRNGMDDTFSKLLNKHTAGSLARWFPKSKSGGRLKSSAGAWCWWIYPGLA